jgi:glutamyl-tRNA synthetase
LDDISPESAEEPLRALAEALELSAGQFFGILRAAITGQTVSPPLLESMEIIGKQTVLERIMSAAERLSLV